MATSISASLERTGTVGRMRTPDLQPLYGEDVERGDLRD
jgi:tRNA G37 N-methylase Trm5